MKVTSVLIADDIEQECLDILRKSGIEVTSNEQLLESLPKHDAVIVRSATKITSELIAAGSKLILDLQCQAAAKGIELLSLEEIWPQADYITVHVPLIQQTENLINTIALNKCKRGALNSGQVGGAAFDVFVEEPPKYRDLVDHPKVICTPHLGASTIDAQLRVASEIAENIIQLNQGNILGALNAKHVF
uniref:2-Hacid_dh_C domain-containing protein n=1 Tax=Heterorhabditis bacteriophora TaxID=37862 RepID=A0A1I7WBT4_HETBA